MTQLYMRLTRWPIVAGVVAGVLTVCCGGSVLGLVWIAAGVGVALGRRTHPLQEGDGWERAASDAWFGVSGLLGGVGAVLVLFAIYQLFQPSGLVRFEDRVGVSLAVVGVVMACALAARAGGRTLRGEGLGAAVNTAVAVPGVLVLCFLGVIPAHWSWSLAPLSDDAVITGILVPLFTSVGGAAAYAVAAAARARPLRVGTALCWAARGAALGAVGQTIALLARLTVAGVVSDVRLGTILGVLAGWVAITATGALLSVRFRESPPGPSLLRAAAWAIGCVPLWCGAALLGALADNVRYPRYRDLGPFVAAFLAPLAFGALVVALLGLAIAVGSALADTRRGADNGSGAAT